MKIAWNFETPCFDLVCDLWVPSQEHQNPTRPQHRTSASARSDARDTRRLVGAVLPSFANSKRCTKIASAGCLDGDSQDQTCRKDIGGSMNHRNFTWQYVTRLLDIFRISSCLQEKQPFELNVEIPTRTSIMAAFRNVSPSPSSSNAKRIAPCFLAVRNSSLHAGIFGITLVSWRVSDSGSSHLWYRIF